MTERKNLRIDIILLCETFLSKQTLSMVRIPRYTHVGNYRKNKKGGGVSILIRDGISHKRWRDLDVFEEGQTESVFVEIRSKNGKDIILGSMYKPPNVDITQFSTNLSHIVNHTRRTQGKHPPELILGMDHNMNLLNSASHPPTHKFMEDLMNLNLLPTVTRPTRITHHSAMLIDNIFVSEALHRNFESTILIYDMPNHLPILAMLKQTRLLNTSPVTFESRCLNDNKLKDVNNKLIHIDWIGVLTGTTSNEKFNQFSETVERVLDSMAPIKTVRISAKRQLVEPWMTRGLEIASQNKMRLYKKAIAADCTDEDLARYKQHRNTYNSLKNRLRRDFYHSRCISYRQNAKTLWSLITNTIKKVKHKDSIIPYITVNGLKQYHPKSIANSFGEFYSNLGPRLASQIIPGTTSMSTYLDKIPKHLRSMALRSTTVMEVDTLIKQLPNKTSHGYESISNVMLKALRTSIAFPLCHIFNSSLAEGIFPEWMKRAEVIPLYKGKDMDIMINCRPISLLITLSKLLEKIMYLRLYSYLEKNQLLYSSQYGFCSKRSCEQAITELVGYVLQSKNHNEHSASIFLDLSKAFDTLEHSILLQKLEGCGVCGVVLNWFESYLKNRSLVAKITTGPSKIVKSDKSILPMEQCRAVVLGLCYS